MNHLESFEPLIEQGFVLYKNKAILLEIEEKQKKLDTTSEKADRSLRASQQRLNAKLKHQKEIAKSQLKIIKGLLHQNCTNEILLERHALTDKLLSEDEQKLVLKKRDVQLAFYEETINEEVGTSTLLSPNAFKKEN